MDQQLICELNLALIPEAELASRYIAFSRQMAGRYPSVIQLNGVTPRVAFTPHVTLYQVPVQVRDLPGLHAALLDVAARLRGSGSAQRNTAPTRTRDRSKSATRTQRG